LHSRHSGSSSAIPWIYSSHSFTALSLVYSRARSRHATPRSLHSRPATPSHHLLPAPEGYPAILFNLPSASGTSRCRCDSLGATFPIARSLPNFARHSPSTELHYQSSSATSTMPSYTEPDINWNSDTHTELRALEN
jgi:hypothetical protein